MSMPDTLQQHNIIVSDAAPDTLAIDVQDVSRLYDMTTGVLHREHRQVQALDGITLSVEPGESFGLVGPNGAGKTTLIKILTTLLLPTSGRAYVLGMDVARQERKIRGQINAVFGGDRGLYTRLSGESNLRYFSDLYQVPRHIAASRIPRLLDMVGLRGREQERVEGYSRGMKQRLHIAKALINDPDILFLDEPTIGLDPSASRRLWAIITDLQSLNKTIVLTSHYMHEVDLLCKRVAVINKGHLITVNSPRNLKRLVTNSFVIEVQLVRGGLNDNLVQRVRDLECVGSVGLTTFDQMQLMTIQTSALEIVTALLREQIPSGDIGYMVTREPTLEDAYVKLVGLEA